MTEVETRLASLAATSKELNEVSDALTASIRSVEERLAGLKLGIITEVSTPFHTQIKYDEEFPGACVVDGDEEFTAQFDYSIADNPFVAAYKFFLEYRRYGDTWRILVRRDLTPYDFIADREMALSDFELAEDVSIRTWTPLLDCSREIRVSAAPHIAELIGAIDQAARTQIQVLRHAMVSTEEPASPSSSGIAPETPPATRKRPSKNP